MDPFANLTALSPPESRQKSAAMGTQKKAAGTSSLAATTAEGDDSTTSVSDLSSDAIGLDDSVNIQCSADPSAFTGFQTRRHGHHVATAANTSRSSKGSGDDQKRMRLALDLRSTAKRHDFRSQGVSISQLSQNTSYSQQDFTELFYGDTQEEIEQIAVARAAECRTSPPPTLLSSMESEWRKRSERNTTAVIGSDPPVQIKSSEMTVNESNTSQEIRMKHAAASTSIVTGNRLEDRTPTHGFRETILDDSLSSSPASDHHECSMDGMYLETERFFSSDEGGANDRRRDSISSFPDTQSLGDEEEDQDASDDDVEMMDKKQRETSVDEDEEPPTQPSASIVASEADSAAQASSKSTQASSPNRAALKRRETIPPHSLPTVTDSEDQSCEFMDSSCKCGEAVCRCGSPPTASAKSSSAIRNLEFSFAMPDSQESQSQAFGAKSGGDKLVVATAPLLPPSLSSAPVPTRKSEKAATKRDIPKTPSSIVKKQKKTAGDSTPTGTSSGASTPTKRKRKRAFVSPDADMKGASAPGDDTPIRRSTRGSASTPTTISTPSVRTRAKYLSPLPSNRAYVSRSRTIFKYKFEFCLTGFMKDGEVNLMELIEEHGGKIAERYQDVFHKNNIKAVVIATPVSWRKLKFIYAIACGIPVVHPEWIHACVKAGQVIPFEGYFIPSGYSITTRKFECRPVQQLSIFAGLSFGIPHDVVHASKTSTRNMGSLIAFILKTCGAKHVVDDLAPSRDKLVDIVLSDEYTKTCEHYQEKHKTPVKSFSWVTECMILQRFLSPEGELFHPQYHDRDRELQESEQVLAANAEIGDSDRTMLKLHAGELVLADLSGNGIDHFLLFHVCEILRITLHRDDDGSSRVRGEDPHAVVLEVGVLKRSPNSHGLSKTHSKVLEIPASHIKRRVVAVSKKDFQDLKYRDESIFYYEEEDAA